MRLEWLGGVAAIASIVAWGTASAGTVTAKNCPMCTVTATVAPAGASSLPLENFGIGAASGFHSNAEIIMNTAVGRETITFTAPGNAPGSGVYSGNTPNVAISPFAGPPTTLAVNNTPSTNYLVAQGGGGAVRINYDTPQSEFDLLWGSVDPQADRNDITLTIPGLDRIVDGNDVLMACTGGVGASVVNCDVRIAITGGATFTNLFVTDLDQNAFEFVKAAPVPEPASLAIFGTALAGFGVLRRRRKTA